MIRLHLVRHGPTHAKTMVGWSDLPADLSDLDQIARLNAFLPAPAALVSSDLIRAVDTANAVERGRTRLAHVNDLREMHFGDWELRSYKDIEAEDPDRIRAFWDEPGHVRPPNGESWNDLRARVDRAIDGVLAQAVTSDVIIVAHFGAILTQVQRALDLDGYETFGHRIDNLSVTQILVENGDWTVERINHLP
ncbi:MAG: histidine phosphatase family protein [Pseudomonadota bacterium]